MALGDAISNTVGGKPTAPEDTDNTPNAVTEGAAVNTTVGITAHSTFANGNASLDYSLSADSSGGGFKIDENTGVVTVADPSKIDFESAPIIDGFHTYTITVVATKNKNFFSETTFKITVNDVAPSAPVDSNAAANTVAEGAANGTAVGITASSNEVNGPAVTWSLTGDTSGGGFTINATTGVITVADGTKIDYESSPSHAYTVTATASDGSLTSSQAFTINVSDVAMTTPVDANGAGNSVAEGAAAGTAVGITASATDPSGPAATYSLIGDTSAGGFTINASTGVVTVANPAKIDFESTGPGHTYNITVQASNGVQTTSQVFTVGVTDVAPSAPIDNNGAANTVAEGAANGTAVGITAFSTDVNGGAVNYLLTGDTSGGGFAINSATGVITVADSTKINYETAPGHAYTVTATASDGTITNSQTFTIAVSDVAPSAPVDSDGATNTVAEGAANGSAVGVTAFSTDVNGPGVTYSLVGDTSNGGFTINSTTGVITVADSTKLDYETTPSHAYTVTAQASDGTLSNSQAFTIALTDVAPTAPTDTDVATNTIAEGAANGSTVGITASSVDPNGPATTYSLTDNAGGRFAIDSSTGVVTVANGAIIDYESAVGHAYGITVLATNGAASTSSAFSIGVTNVAPSTPTDSNGAADSVAEGAANGTAVGITAASTDPGGNPNVTWLLTSDSSGGGFAIDPNTGALTVADHTKIDYESSTGHAYDITVQASDGAGGTASHSFTIGVINTNPSTPTDGDSGTVNTVVEGAAVGTYTGLTASSTDVNGPAVTWSLIADSSGGGFGIGADGKIVVADPTKLDFESTGPGHTYSVTAQASDGFSSSSQSFSIAVSNANPSAPTDTDTAANMVLEGAAIGTAVHITASSTDPNGPAVTWTLTNDSSGGGFAIDPSSGIVTVADPTKIDYETALGHAYSITAQADDGAGGTSSTTFDLIAVINEAPSTPVDGDTVNANSVAEGAAVGTYTGLTASSTDVNGPTVTWSLTADSSNGGFAIDNTGKVTVANAAKIDFESSGGSYSVTAQADDGMGGTSTQSFTITVTNTNPSGPTDGDAGTANSVVEGAATGTYTGLTASSADVNGPTVTWSLTADSSGGGFGIGADGKVVVADPTKLDFETTGPGHTYSVTVEANDTAGGTASQSFNITVTNANPSNPADSDTATADTVIEGAAIGTYTGVTAAATDPNGPAVTWSLTGDTSLGGFTIGADGKINVLDATKINYETATHTYDVTATASDGAGSTSSHVFTISVGDVAPSTPVDSDTATADSVSQGAAVGTYTGVTASSTDVNGPAVTWSLTNDTSGGGFGIDSTGKITVIDSSKIIYNAGDPTYTVTAQASDGTLSDHADFIITVVPNTAPTATADALSATEKGGVNNATGGSNPSGNVITGTGGATADTDAETPGSLTVISFGTGSSGGTSGVVDGTTQLAGAHGSLTLDSTGNFHYLVNQNDPAVEALVPASPALTDTFHYTIQDPGGLTSTAVITVSINGANDLPGAVADAQTITEDAGAPIFTVRDNDFLDLDALSTNTVAPGSVTVSSAAVGTSFVNGDATAAAVNSNHDIQVTLGAAFQQLHAGETATITVPYTLTGNAGETSTVNLVLTVNGANDVPIAVPDDGGSISEDAADNTPFNVRGNDTLDPDHGALNNITIDSIDVSGPAPDGLVAGDITATPSGANVLISLGANFDKLGSGETATVDVHYTLHGDQGSDVSSSTLHFVVNGVNDAPVAQDFDFTSAPNSAIGNTALVLDDGVGPAAPDPAGPQKTLSGSLLAGATDPDGPNALTTVAVTNQATAHGHVTISTTGEFSYTPTAGYLGADSFTYTITDGNSPTAGTDTGTVSLNVVAPKVWYVSSVTGNDITGDGTSEHPFASLAPLSTGGSADAQDGANDLIFLYNGTYTGGIVLESGQQLIGQNQGLTVNGTTLETAAAGNATINGTVTLATGNTIDGITFGNVSGFSLQDSGVSVGTATVAHSSINNANGGAVSIANGGTLAMNFSSITASGTSTSAIALANTTGTFTGSGGTLNNGAAAAADVSITGDHTGDDLNFTYNGAINDSTGTTVAISGQSGGTKDFNGAITGGGIALTTNNTGATMSFDGGVSLSTGASNAFTASGGGTVSVTGAGNSITTTTGTALDLNGITAGATGIAFNNVTTNGAANGILIDTVGQAAGSTGIDINGGSIVNATSRGVDINATSADISIGSSVSTTAAGRSVEVTGTTGNKTIAFSGAIDDNGQGVNLTTNTGTAMNFTGGVQIDASGTNSGFNATGGGTVTVTGSGNHIVTGSGTALNFLNTNIGAADLTFQSISANGATKGISLDGTGTLGGGLHVTGTGAAGTGGTIQGGTHGVYLHDSDDLSLAWMNIINNGNNQTQAGSSTSVGGDLRTGNNLSAVANVTLFDVNTAVLDHVTVTGSDQIGINGNNVNGFTLSHSTVTGNGNEAFESGLLFQNLFGTDTISDTIIKDNAARQIHVANTTNNSTLDLSITGTRTNNAYPTQDTSTTIIGNTTANPASTTTQQGILFETNTTGSNIDMGLNINGVAFNNNIPQNAVDIQQLSQSGTLSGSVQNSSFDTNAAGVIVSMQNGSAAETSSFNIINNEFNRSALQSILVAAANPYAGNLTSIITGNTIGTSGQTGSAIFPTSNANANGLEINFIGGTGSISTRIQNNTIQQFDNTGISIRANGGTAGDPVAINAIIDNNTIREPFDSPGGSPTGMLINMGTTAGATVVGTFQITNNLIQGTYPDVGGGPQGLLTNVRFNSSFLMPGYVGGAADLTAVENFIVANNPGIVGGAGNIIAQRTAPGIYGNAAPLVSPLFAAAGGVQASSPTPGETHLTQAQLDTVVAAAIAQWAHAGASASQLAALHATTFSVADLSGVTVGEETSGHITIDIDAASHGWFVDPTPNDNSEFTHAVNATGTDLYTDPSNAAAGHLDLLTTVTHELGHVLGLGDIQSPADDLMYINLVDGERRLPDVADVAQANAPDAVQAEFALPVSAQAAAGTPIIVGTAANDTIDAGHGGNILFGGAGADNFVFGPSIQLNAPTPAQITHVADYSAAQGDTFDFSAITSTFHNSHVSDSLVVRAVEDASGKFATLQVDHIDPMGLPSAPNWVNVAQLDGAHSGDAVNILIDNNHSVHLAQIHVDLLV
jgi:VCBS repeat-containing protein